MPLLGVPLPGRMNVGAGSLRHQLLVSFAVQGAGAAAVLLATLLLGARLGPEVQGSFNRSKAELEFIAALALFGLPQALFYYVKSGALALRAALRWAWTSALLALPIGSVYAWLQHADRPAWQAVVFGIAVLACVVHGQLRALLLLRPRTEWFNAATALPQLLVLVGVGAVIGLGSTSILSASTWWLLFGSAYGLVGLAAWGRLNQGLGVSAPAMDRTAVKRVGWRDLGGYGLAAWLTAVLSTAAILGSQLWLERNAGAAALGIYTLALTLVQVPLTPLAYAAPLLLRRWMEQPGPRAVQRWAMVIFVLLLGVAALTWGLAFVWPDLGLGPAYAGATRALALLLAGGAAEAASRLLTVQASARGMPWVAVRAETARWAVLAIGWMLPLPPGLLALCAVWACAAAAAALVLVQHARAVAARPAR